MNLFEEVSQFCDLSIDDKVKLPVAIVGAGGIVDGAHLPAYKKLALKLSAYSIPIIQRQRMSHLVMVFPRCTRRLKS